MASPPSTLATWALSRPSSFERSVDRLLLLRSKRVAKIVSVLDAVADGPSRRMQRIQRALTALESTFLQRWNGQIVKKDAAKWRLELTVAQLREPQSATGRVTIDQAATLLSDLAARLLSARMPLLSTSKYWLFQAERTEFAECCAEATAAQIEIAQNLRGRISASALAMHSHIPGDEGAVTAANRMLRLPAGIADLVDRQILAVIPGHGPLVVQFGWLVDPGPTVQIAGPSGTAEHHGVGFQATVVQSTPFWIPALIDLDRDGGAITNSRVSLQSLVLRLLGLLPAGDLKLNVFDPVGLGDSVKYIFQLGEAASRIIGDKVRSTATELHQLLDSVEAHITFVTQKYLGAQHSSLHEYNLAAGEIAEPYRVLLLFDYPKGFERAGGGVDHEAIAQLEKIITSGPRCGVYTLIVTEGAAISGARATPGARWGDAAPIPSGLPVLESGYSVSARWPLAMQRISDRARLASRAATAGGTIQQLLTSVALPRDRNLFTSSSELVWQGSDPTAIVGGVTGQLMVKIEKGLERASTVEVSPERVSDLAQRKRADRLGKALAGGPPVAVPGRPDTWWQGNSRDGLIARVGRKGSADIAEVEIASKLENAHVLVGGAPRSGKSVFLHALIASLTQTYGPDELELFLIDIKMGVEFKAYTASPHARVVALESGREFGISVLQALVDKMEHRGALFRAQQVANLAEYRGKVAKPMPRVVAVIDEFHALFETADALGDEAQRLLRRILKQGSAIGIHLVLASQTLSGAEALPKDALSLVPTRVVFASADADARLLLAEDNPEAAVLNRPGEGIINLRAGRKGDNERFQATLVSRDLAAKTTRLVRKLADLKGIRLRPIVFEGIAECAVPASIGALVRAVQPGQTIPVAVGLPMNLGGPVTARLARSVAGNLLLVGPAQRSVPVLTLAAATVMRGDLDVIVCDFGGLGSEFSIALEPALNQFQTRAATAGSLTSLRGRQIESGIAGVLSLVERRHTQGRYEERGVLLMLANVDRSSQLEAAKPLSDVLDRILDDGPAVGIHTIVSLDRFATLSRKLGGSAEDRFDLRVVGQLSREDSHRLIDSADATNLLPEQLIVYDRSRDTTVVARAFVEPTLAFWRSS
ncbi:MULTISPECIES: FtsK/SpoIIIE domain-containing protein [unclassified Cryobacterium]|uniref:FtsK/SpoIIIE domain-containing protein n=1 Tax=unclassified Cryobacterium TaxID=2649013 RepID=UPI00106D89FC|nr:MULTISPECIES: FtsK/SpoIIIE domain-containing protein [unclassified Cryobacterium]TFB96276.1 DNA translocase FtsK [Cryobacterium sp. MDB2-A-1]TFC12561.1 DNA translocase FtsK [Cryobacterium sp. MDB2-A-2]